MKTVLIVDDERPARELLKMTLDWQDAGFKEPYEARNGVEALALYEVEHPDLVITDIQMPVMNGLELIRAIRALDQQQKIIILSCHESFVFAKEAIRLGVLDYLIKDTLTKEALYDTLSSAFDEQAPMNGSFEADPDYRGKDILRLALQENKPGDKMADLLRPLLALGNEYFCLAIKPENLNDHLSGTLYEFKDEIVKILKKFGGGEVCSDKNDILLVLPLIPRHYSRMNMANWRFNLIQNIRAVLERLMNCRITIGVSSCSVNPMLVRQMIEQARQALSGRVFLGKGKTLYYDPVQNQTQSVQMEALNIRIDKVKHALEAGESGPLKLEISQLYKKDLQGIMQYNYLQHINTVLLGLLTAACSSKGVPYRDVFGTDIISMDVTEQLETVPEMCEWYLERFSRLLEVQQKLEDEVSSPRHKRIISYINENYCSDISLETIADSFDISKVYLAKVFKKKIGQTVNEYIRELKVEHAKKLLCQENIPISQIVEKIGFNNPQTFYNIFKKSVGVSPGQYRESHLTLKKKK